MWNRRPDPKIVIASGWAIVPGWLMILAVSLILSFSVFKIVSGDAEAAGLEH